MSRKMNRRQISPVKIRSVTPPRRVNLNSEVQRIINHAAKLIEEYNKNSIDKILETDQENIVKVEQLLKESKVSLPKISREVKLEKPKRKRKRRRETKKNQSQAESDRNTRKSSIEDLDYEYNLQKESYASAKKFISTLSSSSSVVLDKTSNTVVSLNGEEEANISLRNIEGEETPSKVSIDKSSSCTICSSNQNFQSVSRGLDITEDLITRFTYEIEIKTAKRENAGTDGSIAIFLTGETSSTPDRIILNDVHGENTETSRLFQTGSLDKFEVTLNEHLGPLINVKVGLNLDGKDSSWFFEYIRVNDCFSEKDYYFFCHRWLGAKSPDNITQITLGYTKSLEVDSVDFLSKGDDENTENLNKSLRQPLNHSDRTYSDAISKENKDLINEEKQFENDDIGEMRNNQKTPINAEISLEKAIETNNFLLVQQLCETNKDFVNYCNDKGCSPIQLAAIYFKDNDASREIVDYFIALNIDINSKSLDGISPLHYAVMNDNLSAVKYLLECCNADPTIADVDGNNALDLSIKYDFPELRSYLSNLIENQDDDFYNPSSSDEEDIDISAVNFVHPDFDKFKKLTHSSSTETYFSEDDSTSRIATEPQIVVEIPFKSIASDVSDSSENEISVVETNTKSKRLSKSNNIIIPEAVHKVIHANDRKSISNKRKHRSKDTVPFHNFDGDLQTKSESRDSMIPVNIEISKENILPNLTGKETAEIITSPNLRKLSESNDIAVTETINSPEETSLPSGSKNLSENIVPVVDSKINPRKLSNQHEEIIIDKDGMCISEQGIPLTDLDDSLPILSNSVTSDNPKEEIYNEHFETLEENQLEAENRGIMFHKTISLNDSHNSEEDLKHIINKLSSERKLHENNPVKIEEKDEEDDNESSQYSSHSKSSMLSTGDDDISTITQKSHSEISISDLENNKKYEDKTLSDVDHSKDPEVSTEMRLKEENSLTNPVENPNDILTPLETPSYKVRTVLNRPSRPPFLINRRESENLIKLLILNSILDK